MSLYENDFAPQAYRFVQNAQPTMQGQDVRDGSVYVYEEDITLAVRVALGTGRPLLLLGPPGSGKSSLAAYAARTMNWNYFEQVVTSRTKAQDLLWSMDAIRRLRDAQANRLQEQTEAYIEPRALWWAFDPKRAALRGAAELPPSVRPATAPGVLRGEEHPSVMLIDEIDKADPDVPNDLLVSLGSRLFRVDELGIEVSARNRVLTFITSNNERALPAAFVRRCVVHTLAAPGPERLKVIAESHFPQQAERSGPLFDEVAKKVLDMRQAAAAGESAPSTAEYLDAVRACLAYDVVPGDSKMWQAIQTAVLLKREQTGDAA